MKKKLKLIFMIIIIVIFCGLIYDFCKKNVKLETPDNLYIKINEINDNQSLIGLSEEEVVELLGNIEYEYYNKNKKVYVFYAGKIVKKSIFGNTNGQKYYEFRVRFDENDKVEHTNILLST